MCVGVCMYLQTGLEGGAHQLVMWSAAVQETQVNVEPEHIEQDRNHQQTHKPTHTLHTHTDLYTHTHTISQYVVLKRGSEHAQCEPGLT